MKVLVTGANGFVGHTLINRLLDNHHEVTALVRSIKKNKHAFKNVKWIEGDILAPDDLPKLENIDKAFYLIHGLKEDSEVFENQEAVSAVNFINWIRPTGASVIYLGGLGPKNVSLSPHLRSRHLTGAIFGASGIPTTEFRASIVIGGGSLSFEMVKAFSERLPFRPQLNLLNQPCQPIALQDLLQYLEAALKRNEKRYEIFEIGGADVTTYGGLIDLYVELAGLKRKKITIPEVDLKILSKVMEYTIPEYSDVGKKLAESLEHSTVVTNTDALIAFAEVKTMPLRVAINIARSDSKTHYPTLWEKDFLRILLSDKVLKQSGLFSTDLLTKLMRLKNQAL